MGDLCLFLGVLLAKEEEQRSLSRFFHAENTEIKGTGFVVCFPHLQDLVDVGQVLLGELPVCVLVFILFFGDVCLCMCVNISYVYR